MTKKPFFSANIATLFCIFVMLAVIGLANLYSASVDGRFFDAQVKHTLVGFAVFFIVGWFVPMRWVNAYSYIIHAVVMIALFVVLVLGHSAGGATRWITIASVRLQPSEFAKLAIVLCVAKFFYNNSHIYSFRLKDLYPILINIVLMFVLIFKQPDFGTAGVCLLIGVAQLFFVRIEVSVRTLFSMLAGALVTSVLGWVFFLREYQKLRILNLLNPNMDPTGSGYNSLQSLVAIGSGKQFGKGFLQGTQTQLQFLPARHTDFIFSVFAEEHGFWGCVLVFLLFSALVYLALEIARDSKDLFGSLVAVGVAVLISLEFTINVAMVLGLFPVVGMPLPFFSYGGSALLTICLGLGLLVAVERESHKNANSGRIQGI